jgi:hypothetical protein
MLAALIAVERSMRSRRRDLFDIVGLPGTPPHEMSFRI